jgi:hypothetical protein
MTGTTRARVSHPAVPGAAARFPRRMAGVLAWGPGQVDRAAVRWIVNGVTWAGALLVLASALIHLRLWADGGYQEIAVIGPLFLAQGVAGILLAVALGVFRRLGLIMAGAGLLAGTAVGLLLSVHAGLFGFRESMAAPYAGMSLVVEIAGAVLLAGAAAVVLAGRPRRRPRPHSERVWPPAD